MQKLRVNKTQIRFVPIGANSDQPNPTKDNVLTWVPFISLFIREWLATFCLLLLCSRLGVFFTGSIVTLFINIVFRRPVINPFVLTLGCASAGDWKRANVTGYPGFSQSSTSKLSLLFYWCWMVVAQDGAFCSVIYK